MRVFQGFRRHGGTTEVTISQPNGSVKSLAERSKLWEWSKSFDWATVSDEARSLALALLHEATGADNLSLYFATSFAKAVVAQLPHMSFQIAETQILQWIARAVEEEIFPALSLFDTRTQEEIAHG